MYVPRETRLENGAELIERRESSLERLVSGMPKRVEKCATLSGEHIDI